MKPDDRLLVAYIAAHVSQLQVRLPAPDTRDPVRVERAAQEDGAILWAVRCGGNVLGVDGVWQYEPSPSHRETDHAARFRFASLTDAWGRAVEAQAALDAEEVAWRARIDARKGAE